MAASMPWLFFALAALCHGARPAKDQAIVMPSQGASVTASGQLLQHRPPPPAELGAASNSALDAEDGASDDSLVSAKSETDPASNPFGDNENPSGSAIDENSLASQNDTSNADGNALNGDDTEADVNSMGNAIDDNSLASQSIDMSSIDSLFANTLTGAQHDNETSESQHSSSDTDSDDLSSDPGDSHSDEESKLANVLTSDENAEPKLDKYIGQANADKSNARYPGPRSYTSQFGELYDEKMHDLPRPIIEHAQALAQTAGSTWNNMHKVQKQAVDLKAGLEKVTDKARDIKEVVQEQTRTVKDLSQGGFKAYEEYLEERPTIDDHWKNMATISEEDLLKEGQIHKEHGTDLWDNGFPHPPAAALQELDHKNNSWIYNSELESPAEAAAAAAAAASSDDFGGSTEDGSFGDGATLDTSVGSGVTEDGSFADGATLDASVGSGVTEDGSLADGATLDASVGSGASQEMSMMTEDAGERMTDVDSQNRVRDDHVARVT